MNSKHGFGLIGLLISIAIMALLASIVMKVYFGTISPAQQVEQGIDALDAARAAKDASDRQQQRLQQELSR